MRAADDYGTHLFDLLLQRTSDGVILFDSNGMVLQVNPAAAGMLGLALAEWWEKPLDAAFAKVPQLAAFLSQDFTREQPLTAELRLGKKRMVNLHALPLPDGQRMAILREITDRHDLESRRDALIHTITHDIRNPLMAMGGYIELVSKLGSLNLDQAQYLARAQTTIHKLYEALGELVDLAWLEAGIPLKHLPIQASDLIRRAIENLEPMARDKQITLAVAIQDPLPLVMGDEERLYQAIYNLVHNALLYSYNQTVVAVHSWGDTREVFFSVADQGIGIAEAEIDTIFDRLYRSTDERVKALPGAGLGLTIAKRIIVSQGGSIWVNSTLDDGSKFTFALPSVEN
jgi:PAS domain S-box-containing protein